MIGTAPHPLIKGNKELNIKSRWCVTLAVPADTLQAVFREHAITLLRIAHGILLKVCLVIALLSPCLRRNVISYLSMNRRCQASVDTENLRSFAK